MRSGTVLFEDTLAGIQHWQPDSWYRSEKKFQRDLQNHLDVVLNDRNRRQIIVDREHGEYNADVCVDDSIAIELKRKFDRGKLDRLNGQVQNYIKEYDAVVVVSCGVDQQSAWSKFKKRWFEDYTFGRGETSRLAAAHVPANGTVDLDVAPASGFGSVTGDPVIGSGEPLLGRNQSSRPETSPEASEIESVDLGAVLDDGLAGIETLFGDKETDMSTGDAVISLLQLVAVVLVLLVVSWLILNSVVL